MNSLTADSTLSVLVPLPADLAHAIDALAKQRGQDRVEFIVGFPSRTAKSLRTTFEEMMMPIAENFRQNGMTEEDLDALVEQEQQAMWDEKQS